MCHDQEPNIFPSGLTGFATERQLKVRLPYIRKKHPGLFFIHVILIGLQVTFLSLDLYYLDLHARLYTFVVGPYGFFWPRSCKFVRPSYGTFVNAFAKKALAGPYGSYDNMYLLTKWEGGRGKYLARGPCAMTKSQIFSHLA